ncbi:MAG: leucine-rich repeat protein [Clostridia bacterium]|nr:leucine-rich repeat protein [Clostridia bacterium]
MIVEEGDDIVLKKYTGNDSKVIIPNGVTIIELNCFEDYKNLTSIEIPSTVKEIGSYAFSGCINLISVEIPNSVTKIGYNAFRGCTNLKNLSISDSVFFIGTYAFSYCVGLKEITMPKSSKYIGYDIFAHCDNLKYNEYDNGLYLGNSDNPYYVLIKAKNEKITTCEIHRDTKVIADYAFEYCENLERIEIPNGITRLGEGVFNWCFNLKNIVIPSSVTKMDRHVFVNFDLEKCENVKIICEKGSFAETFAKLLDMKVEIIEKML